MARIRTVKPSFFTSLTVASLPVEARLTFIGMWTHVDDEGRCIYDPRLIKAALWPLDDRTAADVEGDVRALTESSLIAHYVVKGRSYLVVSGWDEHQRINRPTPSTLPAPSDGEECPLTCRFEPSVTAHVSLTEGSRPEGKGREGKGREQGRDSAPTGRATQAPPRDAAATAQTLVAEWIDNCSARPPSQVIGQIAKHVGAMLDEGIPYADVRRGLQQWQAKNLNPSTLPSVVHEVRSAPTRQANGKPQTFHDDKGNPEHVPPPPNDPIADLIRQREAANSEP